jgi:predicted enzyme related to lactoylglutathione lyase
MKLINNNISVGIWSENYERLAKWYEEVLSFKVKQKMTLSNDTFIEFDLGNNSLFIGQHSEIHGQNKDGLRIMIGFDVESVGDLYNELKDKGVEFIAPPFEAPSGGFWCTTLKDPEGNVLQFYGTK